MCQDSRTCSQLNQYLLQGGERHLFYQAIRNDLVVSKLSEKFQIVRESDGDSVRIENAAIYKTKVTERLINESHQWTFYNLISAKT